ncbi:MAG: hypothetical protein MZV65_38825 [Chromatiales bacterium]|nr:hypothetical protein [Chromatiales bacterium]
MIHKPSERAAAAPAPARHSRGNAVRQHSNTQPGSRSIPEDPDLLHALRPIAERGFRVLRVIYNDTRDPAGAVVTAYFDDTVKDLCKPNSTLTADASALR